MKSTRQKIECSVCRLILILIMSQMAGAADVTYSGRHADWVERLLGRVGSWSCPSSMTAKDGHPPQVKANTCYRDVYVAAAVSDAWAAECYHRAERDTSAQEKADDMMQQLRDAQRLCSKGPTIAGGGSCDTEEIYKCNEL